ncbi:DUF447 domain-containing protein [Methanobacterium sp.]|uniref:DUF447 domain-containing protein n=1 Tax=Methanobacterium sp. TaxID=2164 RepID=UPI0025D41AB2|nr:DUF447 domain-containing protein [Methanobacterium sp.]MBI5458455.1 DUF447 family protein [Methanobacterium sp.]
MLDLYSVGMERGLLYEVIVTTRNPDGTPNAAPIGVICKEDREVVVYLHEGSKTFDNVRREKSFCVNILRDPMVFVESTLGNLDSTKFQTHDQDLSIKGAEAFFTVEVTREKLVQRQDHLGTSTLNVVNAKVLEVVKNQEHVHPLNRAIYGIIEALVYLSRIDIVSEDEKKAYLEKISETSRVVNKVGSEDHKKAMKKIIESLEK